MQAKKLASGTILRGEYVLLGVIGESRSNVFRAHHRRDNRLVAVRIQEIDSVTAVRSLDVPNAAMRVRDPLLASVEACGQIKEGFLFVVSEYVSGQRMDRWADKVGIPPPAAVISLVLKLSRALQEAHREGIAHGAINPRNLVILRDDSGSNPSLKAKLLDLGVPAVMRMQPPRLLSSYFMAPEQLVALLRADGEPPLESNSRMDVYGCGALLYHLCTGGPPYLGRSIGEVIAAHSADKLLLPSRINPRIPAALELVILRALANDPQQRYANGGELADALEEIRHASGISGVVRRTTPPSARDSPVDLSAIFSGFGPDERPTSEVPSPEVSSAAKTTPPPADTEASEADPTLPSIVQSAPPSARAPSVVPRSSPTPRASSAAARSAVAGTTAPPSAARAATAPPTAARTATTPPTAARPPTTPQSAVRQASASPFFPPPPPIPAEARRDQRVSGVPAGSFSSAPPQPATQRSSDPRGPLPAPLEQPRPSAPTPASVVAPVTVKPVSAPDKPAPHPYPEPFARFRQLDRRLLGLSFVCVVLVIGYFALQPPPKADSHAGALVPQSQSALAKAVPSPQPQSDSARAPAQPPVPLALPPDPAPAAPRVEIRGEPRSRSNSAPSSSRTTAPRSTSKAAKAPPALQITPSREPERPLAPELKTSAPPSPFEPSPELVAPSAAEAPRVPDVRAAEPVVRPSPGPTAKEASPSEPVLRVRPIEASPPEPLTAATEIRELSVHGSLATSDVRRAIERERAQFSRCYESLARAAGRNTFGEVSVDVEIDESGRAGKSNAVGSALPGLNACVAQATGKLISNKRPDTGTVKASFKLTFVRRTP